MTIAGIIVLLVLEGALIFGLGLVLAVTRFGLPQVVASGALSLASSLFMTLKAWLIFGQFFGSYLWGAIAIAILSTLIGIILQVLTGTMSPEKNRRANVMHTLYQVSDRGPLSTILGFALIIGLQVVLWSAFALVRSDGEIQENRIVDGVMIYFAFGAMIALAMASMTAFSIGVNRYIGPVVRNIFAINSLGGWSNQAWRVAFPFLFLPGPHQLFGQNVTLSTVLAAIIVIYLLLVLIPIVIGSRMYREEKERVWDKTGTLLDRASVLGTIDIDAPIKEAHRESLALDIDTALIDLNHHDRVQRYYAFRRWAPDEAIQGADGHWTVRDDWEDLREEVEQKDTDTHTYQLLDVIRRNWFKALMTPKKRFKQNPQIEGQIEMFRRDIPTWSYRAKVCDALVDLLERVCNKDLKNAAGLAKLSKASLSGTFVSSERGRSILTAALMTLLTGFGSLALTVFEDQIKSIVLGSAPAQSDLVEDSAGDLP